nr:MAG TPA: hypothetical protein [Caudoviricetes sp.]
MQTFSLLSKKEDIPSTFNLVKSAQLSPLKEKIIIKIQLCYFARLKTQWRNLLSILDFN